MFKSYNMRGYFQLLNAAPATGFHLGNLHTEYESKFFGVVQIIKRI